MERGAAACEARPARRRVRERRRAGGAPQASWWTREEARRRVFGGTRGAPRAERDLDERGALLPARVVCEVVEVRAQGCERRSASPVIGAGERHGRRRSGVLRERSRIPTSGVSIAVV